VNQVWCPRNSRLGNRISRAGLPMLVVQEGGYDLDALSNNVQQYFKGLNA